MPESIEHPRWEDMQGLVLSAYAHKDHAQYVLLTIRNPDASRDWLLSLVEQERLTRAIRNRRLPAAAHGTGGEKSANVNLALTADGLVSLCGGPAGLSLDDLSAQLSGFPYPFVEGIAGRGHRSRILGHCGESAPTKWHWGGTASGSRPIHLLLMVFADSDEALDEAVASLMPPPTAMDVAWPLPKALPLNVAKRREHFGFTDGISQPIVAGSSDAERFPDSAHLTALGEFVLGYADESGDRAQPLRLGDCEDFGANGSYLVLSQYAQDVEGFWRYVTEATSTLGRPDSVAAAHLASKIVGRHRDGTPLVPYANRDDNEFDFTEDPFGYGCPLGSHIRRSNPRDASQGTENRHRILRRGRSYGPRMADREPTNDERGLFFMCLNADIERQFEFIQQNWTNNPGFGGLSGECDPLVGMSDACASAKGVFTIQGLPTPARLGGLGPFVTVRGGQYFFLPGIRALRSLGEGRCGKA